MKQNPFNVGDRVRVFNIYSILEIEVSGINGDMVLGSDDHSPRGHPGYHWKQCRRLVKKPRKTIWVNEYYPSDATTWSIHDSESSAKNAADREAITRIAVPYREVKVKK